MVLTDIVTFTIIASLLVISPGPNGLLIAKTVPTSGKAAGFANIVGFVTAFALHGVVSILGISAILASSAWAFSLVKYVGAAYLCWMGLNALWDAYQGKPATRNESQSVDKKGLRSAYLEGVLTNALNPKVSMFYLAAFPQFVTSTENIVVTSAFLVFLHALINALWFSVMVIMVAKLSNFSRSGYAQRWLKGIAGTVFVGFGIKLATLRNTS
jgi:threonine/homoserine/homoserine lactone efflux protein